MTNQNPISNPRWLILCCEAGGFLLIISISWLDELIGLTTLIFGGSHIPDWHEATVESLVTILVALPTLFLTNALLSRLHYLEQFMRVCSWCRKLHDGSDWVPLEKYLSRKFKTSATHGICPDCAETETRNLKKHE